MTSLAVTDLWVDRGEVAVVRDVALSVTPGEWVTIVGPNGAGKTTLVETMAGIRRPSRGEVRSGAQNLHDLSDRERAKVVAFVPQHPIVPVGMTVRDYVTLGRLAYHGVLRSPSKQDLAIVDSVLGRLELRRFADRDVASLSGGERQRAILGRTLAQSTMLIVLDEPTTGLDVRHQIDVLDVLQREVHECGVSVIATLHDLSLASRFANRLVLLHEGRVTMAATPSSVLRSTEIQRAYGVHFTVVQAGGHDIIVPIPAPTDEVDSANNLGWR
jgi:iron complex transport system ATP-binding protein